MPRSILVVDDDPDLLSALHHLFVDEGYAVLTASDGLEAWRAIEESVPDVLVTDVRMPRLDGVALVRRVRDEGHGFPVVVMSAHHSATNISGIHHLKKPFDVDELLRVIARLTMAVQAADGSK